MFYVSTENHETYQFWINPGRDRLVVVNSMIVESISDVEREALCVIDLSLLTQILEKLLKWARRHEPFVYDPSGTNAY
jgi:hypothetical protein